MPIWAKYLLADAPSAAARAGAPRYGRGALPMGVALNNPLNIERGAFHKRPDVDWRGRQQAHSQRFVRFVEPVYGFRAAGRIILNYQKRGLVTLQQVISSWAPAPENDPVEYARLVAGWMDEEFNVTSPLSLRTVDVSIIPVMLICMTRVECGYHHPFVLEQAEDGWVLARDKMARAAFRNEQSTTQET